MPLRFRRSIKIAPGVRLNIGKKSVGVSAGGKYGGVSWNSRTGSRARVSAPGTGLSYVTTTGGTKQMESKPKKPIYKKWWFWILLLCLLGSCGGAGNNAASSASKSVPSPSPAVSAAAVIVSPSAKPTTAPTSTSAPTATPTPTPTPTPTATPTPTPKLEEYILNTNTYKFHETYCSKAKSIKESNRAEYSGTREELIQRGYEPCSVCQP